MKKKNNISFVLIYAAIIFLTILSSLLLKNSFTLIVCVSAVGILANTIAMLIFNHKTVDEESKFNSEMLTALLEGIGTMVIVWKTDFSLVSVNSAFTKSTGYSGEDCLNLDVLKKVLPAEAFSSKTIGELATEKDVKLLLSCKNGNVLNVLWNTSVLKNTVADGSLMMSIGMDFTKTAEMEQKLFDYSKDLANSESRYTMSLELSEIGILLREINSGDLYISEQLQLMLGIPSSVCTVENFRERVYPKDRISFDLYCKTSFDCEDMHKIHNTELRIKSADATYHWYSFRYKISDGDDDGALNIGGSMIDITRDKEKDYLIEKMAYIDEVTQIYNRNKFMEIGQETYLCSSDINYSYWVIVIDIDKFHIINDTCGYQNGNRLLKDFALIILGNLSSGGFGARIGGDNFALIIRDDGNSELPILTIKNIQHQLANLAVDGFSSQTLSCSAGYAKMPDDGSDFVKILDHAEFSLSLSDGTRNKIIRYDHKMHDSIIAGNEIEKDLAKAIDNNEMKLYYQPKINLATGEVFGMEALIRWIKPDGTIIPPNFFIPVAENSMLITRISDFVLYEACRQNKAWQDAGLPKFTVSINLTSVDFYQTDVKQSITAALEKTGLEPQWLEVELTESLALKDVEQAIHQMNEIKKIGVKLSMDDFGTGYSSLSYIQILPITLLKLDRSFIMYLEEDEVSREIVSAVIRIAKSKKIETIAEGIETSGQADILRRSGCDHAQGFFFGKPMPPLAFEQFITSKTPMKARI
ncbi:MAG: bifunctional diguanylate cyclase/phosphodiesterase [Oscillospiraceae bacterium]